MNFKERSRSLDEIFIGWDANVRCIFKTNHVSEPSIPFDNISCLLLRVLEVRIALLSSPVDVPCDYFQDDGIH